MKNKPPQELINKLRDPNTIGHRGTLVYDLKEYDCVYLIPELVNCIITGSFEEVQHAIDIIQDIDCISESHFDICFEQLEMKLFCKEFDDWRLEAIRFALDVLKDFTFQHQ